ncbi:MAG: glycosyltransferase family 4 protein [Anaerolineae bacterium]|jgi:glycosyltransferase involved in cell wall biosynthesis|nr:glycosyltransferase family 4 protein [Anaerolineae bacterium]
MTHIGINAHLLSDQPGYRQAGIHVYLTNTFLTLPHIAPKDWRFSMFVSRSKTALSPDFITIRSTFETDRPLKRIAWEQGLQPWQVGQFDLLHSPAFVVPLIARLPQVLTIFDLSFLVYPDRLPRSRWLYLRYFTQISVHRARRIIVISENTAQDVVQRYHIPREKIDLARPGIRSAYHPLDATDFRQQHGLPPRFLLHVGTIEPRKNLPMLLRAYATLTADQRAELPLYLIGGKGWGIDEVETTIRDHHLERDVHLMGFVPENDLPYWYNAATVMLMPSVYEGWSMPVTEALACGTPVIASTASSVPEAVGTGGICLPPDDQGAWSDALRTLPFDDAWLTLMRARALDHARQFTWEAAAQAIIGSYQHALDQPK